MKIHYNVSMDEPGTHYFRVVMSLEGLRESVPDGVVTLAMPVWTPGSYLVREFARNVLDLAAVDGSGAPVEARKDSKDRWVLSCGNADRLEVTYRVYAFRHTTHESYLDSWRAVINGASVFLYVLGFQNQPLTVQVSPYAGWRSISTGLEPLVPGGRTFGAPDYDVLVDSPIAVGNQHVHTFEVQGVEHEVSISAERAIDEVALVGDIKRIVEHTVPVFGEIPYKRYVFLVDFTDQGYGGLEHLNSTHCIAGYLMMEPVEEYRVLLTLFSHEFFHAWNVKRLRPKALGPFDYSRENYTKSLWISEGITSYYELLILRRAGIISAPEFFDLLAQNINQVKSLPSSRSQSPEESSFDTWIKFYREDENAPNVSASYYRQGAVLGSLLDLQIRKSTATAGGLDDAMRRLYQQTYKEGRGFTDEEFERACSEVSQGGTDELFARHVKRREEIDFDAHLEYAGLVLKPKTTPTVQEGFLGVKVRSSQGLTVAYRLFGSPAEASDLSAGDEIIAVDGLRMDAQRFAFYIANRKPGTTVSILFSREGVIRTADCLLAERPALEFRVQKQESASQEKKDVYRSWVSTDWDTPLQYKEHRTSPARVSRLDYV